MEQMRGEDRATIILEMRNKYCFTPTVKPKAAPVPAPPALSTPTTIKSKQKHKPQTVPKDDF
jgi:hypothetical protein